MEPRAGSEWISNRPIVLVCKKDGSLDYCINYWGPSATTKKVNYSYLLPPRTVAGKHLKTELLSI